MQAPAAEHRRLQPSAAVCPNLKIQKMVMPALADDLCAYAGFGDEVSGGFHHHYKIQGISLPRQLLG